MKYHLEFDIEFKIHNYPGKLIAIEGNEGAGKTTQSKLVVRELKKRGVKAVTTKEPTNSVIGKLIREVLSSKVKVPRISIQYLFGADRAIHQLEIIDYLKKGYIVVTDRYFWSSVAYGISDMTEIDDYYLAAFSLLSFYNRFLKPDMTFYLDVDMKTAFGRISKSKKHTEIYDNEIMFPKIERGYQFLLKRFPKEFIKIDTRKPIEQVTEEIISKLT